MNIRQLSRSIRLHQSPGTADGREQRAGESRTGACSLSCPASSARLVNRRRSRCLHKTPNAKAPNCVSALRPRHNESARLEKLPFRSIHRIPRFSSRPSLLPIFLACSSAVLLFIRLSIFTRKTLLPSPWPTTPR